VDELFNQLLTTIVVAAAAATAVVTTAAIAATAIVASATTAAPATGTARAAARLFLRWKSSIGSARSSLRVRISRLGLGLDLVSHA
jgi:hypothetical protein